MEFNDLMALWHQHDERLDQLLKIDYALLRDRKLSQTRSALHRLAFFVVLDLVFAVVMIGLLWSYIAVQWPTPTYLVLSGLVLAAFHVLAAVAIRQLHLIYSIDYAATVTDIQLQLSRLRATRIRTFKWVILLSPLVGFLLVLVGLHALLGFDLLSRINSTWVVANVVFGILFIPVGAWFAGWLARGLGDTRLRRCLDDISGVNLRSASRCVEELSEYHNPIAPV